ncbi:MAG: hypothetical protein Q8Q09_17040 [Deltaproteobacteria bacterium]|nr:hypothetical protein [Deltaproteobacteria bacterium]
MTRKDSRWLTYAALSASARTVLPPFIDGPVVRAIRRSMFERIAREASVTVTAEARELLLSIEDPMSAKGRVEKGARWLLGRIVPGLGTVDTSIHLLTTFATGALFTRYLARRSLGQTGRVIDGFEATRVRRALKIALDFTTQEHARGALATLGTALGAASTASIEGGESGGGTPSEEPTVSKSFAKSLADRAIASASAGAQALPQGWIDAIEPIFWREFDR